MKKELKILIVCGPTASGKSALALELAQKHNGVIINADSQQMYKELRVLTARPAAEEEALAPHRLYGLLSAADTCSAGIWLRYAKMEIDWALSQGQTPIVTGGTGMYLKALLEGINDIPDVPPYLAAQSNADLEAMGHQAFHDRLNAIDPASATRIKVGDSQRLARAYAVWLSSGKPLSYWQSFEKKSFYPKELFEIFNVDIERDELYQRIDARVLSMLEQGAVDEVKALLALQLPETLPAMRIIGVPELRSYLKGSLTIEDAAARIQQATRNYAKRQMTWFRHQLPKIDYPFI